MATYKAKECRCWNKYPNTSYKRKDGTWKCKDCYEVVRDASWEVGKKWKTVCKLREVKDEKSDSDL